MDEPRASEAQMQIAAGAGPVKAAPAGPPAAGPCGPALTEPTPSAGEASRGRGNPADLRRPRPMRRQPRHITSHSDKIRPSDVRATARVLDRARRVIKQRTLLAVDRRKAAGRLLGVPHPGYSRRPAPDRSRTSAATTSDSTSTTSRHGSRRPAPNRRLRTHRAGRWMREHHLGHRPELSSVADAELTHRPVDVGLDGS